MNGIQMLKIVEEYIRKGGTEYGDIRVTRLPDQKTVFVELNGDMGRSILMTEYQVDGKHYRAGYSQRSETVYVSQVASTSSPKPRVAESFPVSSGDWAPPSHGWAS